MKNKILSVGHMEFPIGLAQVQRQLLLARAVQIEGYSVTVLCRYGIHDSTAALEPEGEFEGVHYIYCSGATVRPSGFIKRNILKFKGLFNEIRIYRKYAREGNLAGALVSTNSFYNIVFYYLLGKFFGVTSVVDNVEYWTSNKNFKGFERFDKSLYDKYYSVFADKIICISDFLMNRVKSSRRKNAVKIPAITDFSKFVRKASYKKPWDVRYFLYCGSEHYFDVIDFVVSSYEKLESSGIYLALLTKHTDRLTERLDASPVKSMIRVFQKLPYAELVDLYLGSEALIIPLRDIDQDKARFPHKISEYCASSRPVVTSMVGEMRNYFDNTNSYLCAKYDQDEFAEQLQQIIRDPQLAEKKAQKSFELGLMEFNYSSYSRILVNMFNKK